MEGEGRRNGWFLLSLKSKKGLICFICFGCLMVLKSLRVIRSENHQKGLIFTSAIFKQYFERIEKLFFTS